MHAVNAKNNTNKKGNVKAKEKETIENQQSEFTNTSTSDMQKTKKL